jgi:redox-sensitive bicupin YhaK (pirin superfamily)
MSIIEQTIAPRERDLGGFSVRRVLPHATRPMVGPFIFLDHMGPAEFPPAKGIDVRPHPHIGLATVTYLFEGELFHRDSLRSAQEIRPGAVNWMTAGRGITHSERTGPAERAMPHRIHGLQIWVALPVAHEETAPEFFHHPAETIPCVTRDGATIHVVAGEAFGAMSPVKLYSPLFYADVRLEPGGRVTLPDKFTDRAAYVIEGEVVADGHVLAPATLSVFNTGAGVALEAKSRAHLVLLGGEPFAEPRHIWWNFVSSSKARIEQAKRDWKEQRFPKVAGDTVEFTPLPEG